MLEINMLNPKGEEMALKNYFILPLWKQSRKTHLMILVFRKGFLESYYILKKVIKLYERN